MADRYWVGGTANWDGTAGTKWATTSGGAGGASVPTSADDVFFDAASTGTCTIASGNTGAKSINCTGFTGTLTGSAAITVSGSITLSAGMTYTHSGLITINGTGTLTTAGKSFSRFTVNSAGITVTLGDALTLTGDIDVSRGTFNTANYNVTAGSMSSSIGQPREIILGSSTVTIDTLINFSGTPSLLTFNAGTSQINLTGSTATIQPGGKTFYNVSFTNTTTNTRQIAVGEATFNNLSVAGPASAGVVQFSFSSPATINGTLSTTGTAGNRRVWFRGFTYGLAQTLTINSAPSLTDADFRDIYVIGTAAPISGTRIGNLRGCSGITFSTPKTVYWNLAGAQNWSANGWSDTSTGTPSIDFFPLAQDTATFTNAGSVTGTITMDSAVPYTGTVDMSGRTSAMTLATTAFTIYGDWKMGSGTTMSSTGALTFSGRNTQTITSSGKSFTQGITVDTYGGTVQLADALSFIGTLTVTNGTFDTKNYSVSGGQLSSSNSNVRTISLGSSTLSLSTTPAFLDFTTSTNLTFNAGTSNINATSANTNKTFNGGGLTFYNVDFGGPGSIGSVNYTITGTNTFNNLSTGVFSGNFVSSIVFSNNQTINGTLSVSGTSAIQRYFVRSDALGTSRTLTVNTLSATDCDFRDITIAGTAAGSSPTRAGDCGGNSGITFPAAKTVYRVGTNTTWGGSNSWALTSGGTGSNNNFPLAQDTTVINQDTALTGTLSLAAYNSGALDASSRTTGITIDYNAGMTWYGSHTLGSGVTVSGLASQTFSGRSTMTFTSAGKTITFPLTVDTPSGTFQLGDAITTSSARTLTLTSGTFDTNNYNVTTGLFVSSNTNTRTITLGSSTVTLGATGTVWDIGATNLTFNAGTSEILLSSATTTTRTFAGGGLSYNKLTIGGAGTSTTTITSSNQFTELASTKTVAHTIALGTTTQTFGKWTVTGTAGNVVTLTGTGTSHSIVGACTSGIDYLAMGSIGFSSNSPGEFYAGANSTGTAGAPVYRTAKPADSTRYWVGGTGNWSNTNRWSTSSGGSGGASIPRSHDDVVFDSASNATSYSATVNAVTGGVRCKSLTISGPASGDVTFAGTTEPVSIHGNVTLPATGLTRTFTGDIRLSGSSTGLTFTTNGVALGSAITINGVDCGWTLGSALNTSGTLTVTNGTFDTSASNYSLTITGNFQSSNSNTRTITLNGSTVTVNGATGINLGTGTNLTFNAGTSQINSSSASATFNGGSQTFYNVSFTSTAVGTRLITGANTFNDLTLTASGSGLSQLAIEANQTVNGTLTCAGSSAIQRGFVRSGTIGTTRTITAATLSADDCDFRDITIAGGAAGTAPTRAGDCGGNSGITFPAPKTVYWNLAGSQNWSATGWATTSNGTPAINNFPLAQDTAIFTDVGSAGAVTLDATWNIGTLDASARTSAMGLTHNNNTTLYGSYALGSGVTVSGGSGLNFSGRGTMTLTSAGKSLGSPITIDAPGGTLQLGDAVSVSITLTLTRGTFNANNYDVTAGLFISSNYNTRTITMGSGLWTLSGAGTAWNLGATTNLTFNKDTANIVLSNTTISTRTFDGGGLTYNKLTIGGATGTSTLTFVGDNTFSEIASTKTVAHTINMGTTTQRVGAWTVTGTSGNVVTVTGTNATTPCTLIYTGTGTVSSDYLVITGVRAYPLSSTWDAGTNSTNNGSLGWLFTSAAPPAPTATGNFLLFFN